RLQFGVWGPCFYHAQDRTPTCPTTGPAYSVHLHDESHTVNISASWTRGLAIHPIAASVTLIGLLLSLSSHVTVTIISSIVSFMGAIIVLSAFACDTALYACVFRRINKLDSSNASIIPGTGYWLIFISGFLLFFAGITGLSNYKKRSSDRKARINETSYPLTLRNSQTTLV
ncbi:hypothetical protein BDQ17DRAFT_1255961, partial [Cyathus striatus]